MIEINTIQDFFNLPLQSRYEIQKALRTKDRLEQFIIGQRKVVGQEVKPVDAAHWSECRACTKTGQPGWVWVEQRRDDNDIHPSQIDKCIKTLYYACTGQTAQAEEKHEPRLQLIFDLGHAWHDVLQKYGRRGAWVEPQDYFHEVPIDPDAMTPDGQPVLPVAHRYWIRGSADALLQRYSLANVPGLGDVVIRVIHEYKTMNSGQFTKLTSPKPEHKRQANIYAAVFNVPLVVYLYTNKDNCGMQDFPVPFDHSIWSEIATKCDQVQYYVNNEMMPPWEETSAVKNPRECEGCGYLKLCQPPLVQLRRKA